MAHRDGAQRAADTVTSPTGATPAEAGAVDAAATAEAHDLTATGGPAVPVTAPQPVPETVPPSAAEVAEAEPTGRRSRLPRPSSARTPSFGLSLAAIRQRNASSSEGTAELRRSLADKEAQTNELREALDALRRTLDDTTPPNRPADEPPATGGRRRRGLLLLVAALAVVALAGTFLLTRGGDGAVVADPSPTASAQAPSPSATGSSAPVATSSAPVPPAPSSAPAPAVSTTPLPWRDGPVLVPPGIPSTGPGIDAPGTDVTVAIDRDLQHIDVYERAVFSAARPSVSLVLPDVASWGTTLTGFKPVVEDLQVELDDRAVRPRQEAGGWFAIPPAGQQVTRVVLRYRVSGTFVNLNGAGSIRRTIGVPSFTSRASSESADPVVIRIGDPRVLNLNCLSAAAGTTICADREGTTWTARLPSDASPVAIVVADVEPLR